jgi:choline dehydrogenase
MASIVDAVQFVEQEYDFLICGGGTAGLVVATRLSEDPNVTVGVIEAGKSKLDDPIVDVPVGILRALHNPEYDWIYKTVPQVGSNGAKKGRSSISIERSL